MSETTWFSRLLAEIFGEPRFKNEHEGPFYTPDGIAYDLYKFCDAHTGRVLRIKAVPHNGYGNFPIRSIEEREIYFERFLSP